MGKGIGPVSLAACLWEPLDGWMDGWLALFWGGSDLLLPSVFSKNFYYGR